MGNWGLDVNSTRGIVDLATGRWLAPHLGIGESRKDKEKERREERKEKQHRRGVAAAAERNARLPLAGGPITKGTRGSSLLKSTPSGSLELLRSSEMRAVR